MIGPNGKPIESQPPDVRLTCRVEQTDVTLTIHFDLVNSTKEPIYVYDGRGSPQKQVYDGGGAAAHVLVGIPPLPGYPVSWRWAPKATAVAPGASLQRMISLGVPLREVDAYHPDNYEDFAAVTISRVVLRVDFIRKSRISADIKDLEKAEALWGGEEAVTGTVSLPRPVELQRRGDLPTRI